MFAMKRSLLLRLVLALSAPLLACEPVKVGGLQEPGPNAVEVAITSEPPGADVVIDGTPQGPAPRTVRLNPGPHTIKASKSGYFPQEQRLTVRSGEPGPKLLLTLVASH
jgi:hypothetical protein